jgi:hypothetical protein
VQVFLGAGDGTFALGADLVVACGALLVLADLNGDSRLDLATAGAAPELTIVWGR